MCDKAVANHPSTIEFVLECYKIHEMCGKAVKAVNICFLYLILFLIGIKLKKSVTQLLLRTLFYIILS